MSSMRERIIKIHPLIEGLIRILECPESYAVIPNVQDDSLQKSAERASELLVAGGKHYGLRQYDEATLLFNESIATAPPNSASLGIAYDSRSALSLSLECFENCLLNINRGLSQPVPEIIGKNLVQRKLWCWEELQSKLNPAADSEKVGESVHRTGLDADLPCPESSTCHQIRIDLADITPDNLPPRDPLWDTEFNNPLLPNVSSKVKIEQNLEYGRHLLATEDIEPGEILWIQDYYSLMNLRSAHDDQYSHCTYCTAYCEALIPCLKCTQEMYCSLHCRKSAYNAYHRTECKLLTFLPKPLRSSARIRLSLRIFLTGTKQGADLNKLMNDPKVFKILEEESNCVGVPYVTNDYLAILNLRWRDVGLYADSCTKNEDCGIESSRPVVQKETITNNNGSTTSRNDYGEFENNSACLIMRSTFLAIFSALKRIGFFYEKIGSFQMPRRTAVDDRLTDAESFACVLLLQNLLVLKQNYGFIHSFSAVPQMMLMEQDTGWIQLGSIADLMNHSCNPNTATINNRRKILTYSLRPIKAGEQLFTHYQCSFHDNPLKERQEYLKSHYNMVCRCPACVHNWTLLESSQDADLEFSKLNKNDVREIQEVYEWWKHSVQKRSLGAEIDLEKALQCRKIIHKYMVQPSIIATFCERYILLEMKTKCEY